MLYAYQENYFLGIYVINLSGGICCLFYVAPYMGPFKIMYYNLKTHFSCKIVNKDSKYDLWPSMSSYLNPITFNKSL